MQAALPLRALMLNGLVALMTAANRVERIQSAIVLQSEARRAFSLADAVLNSNSGIYSHGQGKNGELHLCVLWEPALSFSLYKRILSHLAEGVVIAPSS
jgi:hypothetical protein